MENDTVPHYRGGCKDLDFGEIDEENNHRQTLDHEDLVHLVHEAVNNNLEKHGHRFPTHHLSRLIEKEENEGYQDFTHQKNVVRREHLASICDEDEELLEIEKDLPEIHTYVGSPKDDEEYCYLDGLTFEPRNSPVGEPPIPFPRKKRLSRIIKYVPERSKSVDMNLEECDLARLHRANLHNSLEWNTPCETLKPVKAHTLLHPVVSIEVTSADDVEEELDNRQRKPPRIASSASDSNLQNAVSLIEESEMNTREYDSDGEIQTNEISQGGKANPNMHTTILLNVDDYDCEQMSASSEDVTRASGALRGRKVTNFFSKIRRSSHGDIGRDVKRSRASSASSVNSDFGEGSIYDSDSSLFKEGHPQTVNVNLVSKYRAKIRDKRQRVTDFLKHDSGHRHHSDHGSNGKAKPFVYLDVPGETSDFLDGSEQSYARPRSKSDSRLDEPSKSKEKHRFSESKVVTKLKGLRHKKDHHQSMPSVKADNLQNVIQFSPDPYSESRPLPVRRNSKERNLYQDPLSNTLRQNHAAPHFGSHPTLAQSKMETPLGDIAVESYYGPVESIYDDHSSPKEQHDQQHHSGFHRLGVFWHHLRGKSRSVDHTGLPPPFDLDILRRGSPTHSSHADSVDGSKENVAPTDKCASPATITPGLAPNAATPPKPSLAPTTTTTYTVEANDTLMSIAARFDTTPSELTKLNRLSSRYLFPGQSLLVPLKASVDNALGGAPAAQLDAGVAAASPRCPRTPANSLDADRALDQDCLERFLKIHVRHVTDGQGIVSGVLLVTPNAVMFDPDVSDPLVLERGGAESYGLIAPMECVANAAIYSDIAHMRVKDTKLPRPELPKPEIYYSPCLKRANLADSADTEAEPPAMDTLKADQDPSSGAIDPDVDSPLVLSKDVTFPELSVASDCGKMGGASSTGSQDDDSSCSCGGETRDSSAFPKAFEAELLTPDTYPHSPVPPHDDPHDPTCPSSQRTSFESASHDSTTTTPHETLHESLSSGLHSQPLMTIEEDSTIASNTTDNTITIGNTASRNVSCDSAVSVSSEVDLIIGSSSTPDGGGGGNAAGVDRSSSGIFEGDGRGSGGAAEQPALASGTRTVGPPQQLGPDDSPAQASRKQKVLKRLSNPLSWMDSFSSDGAGGGGGPPSSGGAGSFSSGGGSTPPIMGGVPIPGSGGGVTHHQQDFSDPSRQSAGVLSSVFNMTSNVTSNVSNMLTRRPSLDLARRASPYGGQGPFSQETPPTSAPPTMVSAPPTITAVPPTSLAGGAGEHKRAQFKDGANMGFRSLVPMDDVSNLFTNVDKIVGRKHTDSEESALYLCLRMGLPKVLPRSPFMSYGNKIVKAEYWFSIPRSKAPDLCRLLNLWSGGIYGEIDEAKMLERGLTLILEDTDLSSLENGAPGNGGPGAGDGSDVGQQQLKEMTRESWEVGPMSDELRRALYSSSSLTSLDVETFLPEMLDSSDILDHQTYKNLYRKLPARLQGYSWRLAFSTSQHGFSLSSVYRKMQEIQDTPIMIVIQDTQQTIFGALVSNTLRVSDTFYGTGESFIFTCHPEFTVYNWTGENTYYIKGNNESLVVGGGDHFGLWLDGDLYRGRSQSCKTYSNPVLGPSEDFVIKSIECWAFL